MATQTITTWVDGAGGGVTFPSPGIVADLAPGAPPWNTQTTQGGAPELHVAAAAWPGCPTATTVTAKLTLDSFEYLSTAGGGGGGTELLWSINETGGAIIASGTWLFDSVGPAVYGPFSSGAVSLTPLQAQNGIFGIITVDVFNPTKDVNLEGGRLTIDGDIDACLAAAEPIPVDDSASTVVNVPVVVSVGTNDDNTPCAPGCAVFREGVPLINPLSTATGIVASVDAAGVATVEASGVGVAVINVESGCSPSCDAAGLDVTSWVPQTLTVTITEPAACVEVAAVFDPVMTADMAALFGANPGDPTGPVGEGAQQPDLSVYSIDASPDCIKSVTSIQVSTPVHWSNSFDPAWDGLTVAVFSDPLTFTTWGTATAASGDASVVFPESVSSGYTDGGGTLVPLVDGTWTGGPSTPTLYIAVTADASGSLAGEFVSGEIPTLCVTFGDPSCAPTPETPDGCFDMAEASKPGCWSFG